MPLVAPEYQRVPLGSPPLQLVVAQVQFPPILGLLEPRLLSPFQEAIREAYPRLNRVETLEVSVGPSGMEARPSSAASWAFEDPTETWRVLVDANSLSLETRRYSEYPELRRRFLDVLTRFAGLVNPGERTRLGLRYVNQIRVDGATNLGPFRPLFRPELLGLAAAPTLTDDDIVKHSLGETRLADMNGQLIARYGYFVGGQDPAGKPSQEPTFLIDLDHFDVRRISNVSVDEIGLMLDEFHEAIYRVFRWALTAEGERHLGMRAQDHG